MNLLSYLVDFELFFFFFTTVLWKPYFVSHPEDVSIYEGDNVTLSCSATGFPEAVIGWLKDNVAIGNFSTVSGNSSLVLRFVKSGSANGKYKCVAWNSLGKTFSLEGTLTVTTQQAKRGKDWMTITPLN